MIGVPMPISAYLSSKLGLISRQGFALRQSRQPHYQFEWHTHDCAMLLWPQQGGLKTAWLDAVDAGETGTDDVHTVRLARSAAILLPSHTAHQTASVSERQHHAELYLAPELLRNCGHYGPLQLDGATVAMLDALTAPSLASPAAEQLVRAIVNQLASGKPLGVPVQRLSLPQQMVRCFAAALRKDTSLPSVAAVASELGVSTRQLQRMCLQELGESPIAVRRKLLAAQARRLLAQEGQSLARVSAQLGFSTSGHLTRLMQGTQA